MSVEKIVLYNNIINIIIYVCNRKFNFSLETIVKGSPGGLTMEFCKNKFLESRQEGENIVGRNLPARVSSGKNREEKKYVFRT